MDNSVRDPLIADDVRGNDRDDDDPETEHASAVEESARPDIATLSKDPRARPGFFIVALTLAAGISGLLFGYDTGVISATLVSVGTSLSGRQLTSGDKSVITSSTSLFALFVSPFSSVLADRLGRKKVLLYADFLFIAGAVIQALCSSVAVMVAGRCIIGAGVGAASFVVPLYMAELAPASHRGRLVTATVLFITLGQVVAYVVGWLFATYGSRETGWRWMVGLGALPAGLQAALIVFMPESPRWLVKVGRSRQAQAIVHRVNGAALRGMEDAGRTIVEIEVEIREERAMRQLRNQQASRWKWLGSWQDLVREGKNRRALAIACLLQGLQQLCGFNSLMYFSATIFYIVGFTSPTLTSLTVAVTNFAFTLVAMGLVDKTGRRRILLFSIPFMILGLLLTAFGFSFLSLDTTATTRPGSSSSSSSSHIQSIVEGPAYVVLFSIMVYVAAYALGLGNVPWMQSELFPLSVRSLGSGIATATNWSANFVIGLTFLPLMDALGASWTFVLYACICGAGYVLVWRIYPETAGLSLEEATALLERGWGV